jgi:hypothetical protein
MTKERISKDSKTGEIIRIMRWDNKGRVIFDANPKYNTWWKTEYVDNGEEVIGYHSSSTGYKEVEILNNPEARCSY